MSLAATEKLLDPKADLRSTRALDTGSMGTGVVGTPSMQIVGIESRSDSVEVAESAGLAGVPAVCMAGTDWRSTRAEVAGSAPLAAQHTSPSSSPWRAWSLS